MPHIKINSADSYPNSPRRARFERCLKLLPPALSRAPLDKGGNKACMDTTVAVMSQPGTCCAGLGWDHNTKAGGICTKLKERGGVAEGVEFLLTIAWYVWLGT